MKRKIETVIVDGIIWPTVLPERIVRATRKIDVKKFRKGKKIIGKGIKLRKREAL